jgi:hypothetical protein
MKSNNIAFWASLIGAVVVAFIIAEFIPGDPKEKVVLAIEYGGLVITFLFGFMILAAIASNKIDISKILQEKGANDATSGGASMSRFQLLIFTFVIALSLFLIVVQNHDFPKVIPPEILTLLGISATTYAVSKGIQAGSQSNGGSTQGGTTGTVVTPPGAAGPTIVTSPGAAGPTIVTPPGAAGPTVVTHPGGAGPTVVTHPGAAGPTVVEPPPVDPG